MLQRDFINKVMHIRKKINRESPKRVIIIHEVKKVLIGDSLFLLAYLKKMKEFFINATICVNSRSSHKLFGVLLQNNPYVTEVNNLKWDDIDFRGYDVIVYNFFDEVYEKDFIDLFYKKYFKEIKENLFRPTIFSHIILPRSERYKPAVDLFPFTEEFNIFLNEKEKFIRTSVEIWVTEEERKQADLWLFKNGLRIDEKCLIFVDESGNMQKVLDLFCYIDILEFFLGIDKIKILIFDPQRIDKKNNIYRELLEADKFNKLIFVEGRDLRRDIGLLASHYTRLIFGPSTGIMHCAVGVYNYFIRIKKNASIEDIPILLTYICDWDDNVDETWWWDGSIADCIMVVREALGTKKIVKLSQENLKKYKDKLLGVDEYSSVSIIYYMVSNYKDKLRRLECEIGNLEIAKAGG